MLELLGFISSLITLYIYIIIASAVMSWLIAFNVINPYNQFVRSIWQGLNALTEPVLRPIRRWMPDLGGIVTSGARSVQLGFTYSGNWARHPPRGAPR